jgi:hypothetical protein
MNKVNIIRLSFGTIVRTIRLQATQVWVVMKVEANGADLGVSTGVLVHRGSSGSG